MSVQNQPPGVNRRTFLGTAAAAAAATATLTSFDSFANQVAAAGPRRGRRHRRPPSDGGYGPLAPVRDQTTGLELLMLPRGFEYLSFGWTNDPLRDGTPTPGAHDGMAAFRHGRHVRLVRNHERGDGTPFGSPAYDPAAAGGTTNLLFDPHAGAWLDAYTSLSGTIRNCAGGPTPWGTWLSCEETTQVNGAGTPDEKRHGYVFEVPADGVSDAVPRKGLGRFSHEAAAVDPSTGIVYLTEDATPSGLYRFVPRRRGRLAAGGTLQMLAIDGVADTYRADTGATWRVRWVTIDEPDPGPGEPSVVTQGLARGGTSFSRGEGAWWGNDRLYLISTDGGPARQGQVFEYDPHRWRLRVVFASPAAEILDHPDNVCVSPRGGLVLCEDGSDNELLHGLTPDGEIFTFARNIADLSGGTAGKDVAPADYRGSEWAGATFEPRHGDWLFASLQTPGITVAITGPWRRGGL